MSEKEGESKLEHISAEAAHIGHLAHEAHLLVEELEILMHAAAHATKIRAARDLVASHQATLEQMQGVITNIGRLRRVMKKGLDPKASAKARAAAKEALAQIKKLEELWATGDSIRAQEKAAYEECKKLVKAVQKERGVKAMAQAKLGEVAMVLERSLESTTVGKAFWKQTMTIAKNPWTARCLVGLGAVSETISAMTETPTHTFVGQGAAGIAGGGSGALLMAQHPAVIAADLLAPQDWKISQTMRGGTLAMASIAEGAVTHDWDGGEQFQKQSVEGRYGRIMQAASQAGQFWADKGFNGGMQDFADAARWWMGHH
jgi:hypothetical protein